MANATDQQVQAFVDGTIRPICEQIRSLKMQIDAAIAQIGDVYAALAQQSPTWVDTRPSNPPPHFMVPSDVLAVNTMMHDLQTAIANDAQYPIVLESCVRSLNNA